MSLLGAPLVRHASVEVSFATRKALALLAWLVVEPGPHSREKLTALFWPDSDPDKGRAALRFTLAALRSALGESRESSHLTVSRDALGFDSTSEFDLDLATIEEASRVARSLANGSVGSAAARLSAAQTLSVAAPLWRGELMEGFFLHDAPGFDDWATIQRERWHRRAEQICEQLARAQSEAGLAADATETAARWVAMSPLNEAAHRQLMQAYLTAGEPASALRAYETARALLERELGTAVAPQTEALAERIRATRTVGRIANGGAPAPSETFAEGPLVGRSEELLSLVELYHTARGGHSQVALVSGEAGIGKTRLAAEFLGWAHGNGADVMRGRAFESGGHLPYQPLVDALRPRLDRENAPDDLLADVWLAELARLLPELNERYPDLPPLVPDELSARTRLYEAVVRLVQGLAERSPVVLFMDDVQWADAASLEVLQYAARRWAESGAAVLVLLTMRSETLAEAPALREWLAGLRRGTGLVEVELGPLSLLDTQHLLERLGGAAAPGQADAAIETFAGWLFGETGGQPFFLTEMLRALLERGVLSRQLDEALAWTLDLRTVHGEPTGLGGFVPPGIREVVGTRLTRLSTEARTLLWAAAVLGQGFTFEQLCRVADVAEDASLSAIDEVVRAHLLRESNAEGGPGAYSFTHDKIRDAVHAEAGDARRRVYHRRALEMLPGDAPAAELARHAVGAGLDQPAARLSLQAGDEAMRLLAARDAILHYDRALEIAERRQWLPTIADARSRRAHAFASVALWPDAKRDLESVLATLDADQVEWRAELHANLAEASYWLLDIPGVHHHAVEAVQLATQVDRHDVLMAARGWRAGAYGGDGKVEAGIEEYEQAVSRARLLGTSPPANVLTLHALSLYWLGRLDEAVERSRAGVEAARGANDASVLMYSLSHLGLSLASIGRYGDADEVFHEARQFGREYRLHSLLSRAIAMSAGFRVDLGDFAHAEELSNEARDLALSANWPPTAASANIDLLFNFARRGEIERAENLLAEVAGAVEKASGFHGWLWRLRLAQARAELAVGRGDWDQAATFATDAIAQARERGRRKYESAGLHTRARALIALGRADEASGDLEVALKRARETGDPALFLRVAATRLAVAPDEQLASDAAAVSARVAQSLPDGPMRQAFATSAC